VRIEAALALRALAEVDPTCVGGLTSYGVTNLTALRESVSFEKGSNLQFEVDSLHGQATVLAALVSISPKLPLGYPAKLPGIVFGVSKKMLTEHRRNPVAATVEKEAGWLLLSSLLASLPKEELEEDVFDILALWASLFTGNPENEIKKTEDLIVWSAAVHALTAFIKCFISPNVVNGGVLLQPVLVYLSSALSYVSALRVKELSYVKPAVDIFVIKTLIAYQSLPDPMSFKNDHPQIIQLCTFPFRYASECEESSCLRLLLDKRDAWLGPWIPGRDWFEDELRAFQGGKDGLMPCVWENEISSFPQPETISKTLVNQMLLFFGIIFASQDSDGMLSLLGIIEQCLKAGKKQHWRKASLTNICVGLLAGFKALLSLRPQTLGQEILGLAQSIFLTRSLLGDLNGATDPNYTGSIALALGCIHRSAGGIALSTLVPATVSSISSLAKSLVANLRIWSMHGLLLTIEAAGLSFVSHVQATLSLAMDILLADENGLVDIQQGVGRLINAIVTVLGPELAPGSIFFSRSKSAIAEISCCQETSTMLESARFTQQLVLFAPQAVSVHSHVQSLLSTLSSRQPTLRHLAVSTLRHLIEKDPASVIVEQIEDNLFFMLDEETDSEYNWQLSANHNYAITLCILSFMSFTLDISMSQSGKLSISKGSQKILSLTLYNTLHNGMMGLLQVLATSMRNPENNNIAANDNPDGDLRLNLGDDENMVPSSNSIQSHKFQASIGAANREKYLRYKTRLFAAECLSLLPDAVGRNSAHFDLFLARKEHASGQATGDWLVLHLQELISLAYQISTIQFENMQPVGVGLLGTIVDKFEKAADPELPGHLLLEQYQAQLVSAVRTTLDTSSSPSLLEAGLHLATKILTSGIISGDQVVVRRIFSLISRPLNDFEDIYYPSFAEWVTSKACDSNCYHIKIRLLAAHASLKCYIYASMRKHQDGVPDKYLALLPLFQKSSSILGKYWIRTLKDYSYLCLCLSPKRKGNLFLDGLQSPIVSSKLRPCLDESWPVILQALAHDAVPVNSEVNDCPEASVDNTQKHSVATYRYSMVELKHEDFKFLWGFSLLGLFQSQHPIFCRPIIQLAFGNAKHGGNLPSNEVKPSGLKLYEIVLPMFQFLLTERFFGAQLLTMDVCKELLQVLSYSTYMDNSWNSLAISILSQVAQNCPQEIFNSENFALITMELCLDYLFKVFRSTDTISGTHLNSEVNVIQTLCSTTKAVINRIETKMHKNPKSVVLALVLIGYKCVREASTEVCLSEAIDMVNCTSPLLQRIIDDEAEPDDSFLPLRDMFGTCLSVVAALTKDCIEGFHLQEVKSFNQRRLIHTKLAFSLEQIISISKLALESKYAKDCEARNSICVGALRYCVRCIQTVNEYVRNITHTMAVQLIGLQFLKARIQKGVNTEDNSFIMFLVGEQITDIFTLIHKILKNTITRESVAIASECLSLLVLLQTLSKGNDCQRSFMNLLLEAIVMIFLSTEDEFSQEVSDLRSTAVKLVSRLAQIPSSAIHFKDVLLSMPPLHRQQLQDVIRASVTHDKNPTDIKVPVLDIKMPKPSEGTEEKHSVPSSVAVMQTDENDKEEDEVSEDDWDAFQSFPVSKNEDGDDSKTEHAAEAKDPSPVKMSSETESSIGGVEFQECSISKSINSEKEMKGDEYLEAVKEKHDQTYAGAKLENEIQGMEEKLQNSGLQEEEGTSIPGNKLVSCDHKPEVEAEMEEKLQNSGLQEEGTSIPGNELVSADHKPEVEAEMEEKSQNSVLQEEGTSIPGNELVSSDHKPEVEAEMEEKSQNTGLQVEGTSVPGNELVSCDQKPKVEAETEEQLQNSGLQEERTSIRGNELVSCDQKPELEAKGSIEEEVVSDSSTLQQGSIAPDNSEQHNRCAEDAEKDGVNENGSHHPQLEMSESPIESEHNSMPKLLVLHATQTGNALDAAERLSREAERRACPVTLLSLDQYDPSLLPQEEAVIFVVSTTGQGDTPDSMKVFWRYLLQRNLGQHWLKGVLYAVFGLGDSSYQKYNFFVLDKTLHFVAKKLDKRLMDLGGTAIVERGLGDDQHPSGYEASLDPWMSSLWRMLTMIKPEFLPNGPDVVNQDTVLIDQPKVQITYHNENVESHISSTSDLTCLDIQIGSARSMHPGKSSSDRSRPGCFLKMVLDKTLSSVVVKNLPLTRSNCGKDVRHFEFEFISHALEYETGDVLEILPGQDSAVVDAFIQRCNLDPDSFITVSPREMDHQNAHGSRIPVKLRTFVEFSMDVASASPRRYFFEVMSFFATAEHERERLQYFASPEGRDDLYQYNQKERRTVLEVLEDFPSVQMPFEWLVQLVPPLKTRAFSISSSQLAHPNQVHLTVSVVSWTTPYKRKKKGLCSSWLAALDPRRGIYVPAWFHKGSLPTPSPSLPLILVGPGTGCAPFRGFVEERAVQSRTNSTAPIIFFFGCWNEDSDFLYRDLWLTHSQNNGVLSEAKGGGFYAAFSRDQPQKVYVQHKMREHSQRIWNLLAQGAAVYIAGSSTKMPSDVTSAFQEIVSKENEVSREDAARWIRALENMLRSSVRSFSTSARASQQCEKHKFLSPNSYLGSWEAPRDPKEAEAKLARLRRDYAKQVKEVRKEYIREMEAMKMEKERKDEARREALRLANQERKMLKAQAAQLRAQERDIEQQHFRQTLLKERAEKLENWRMKLKMHEEKKVEKKELLRRQSSMWIDEGNLEKKVVESMVEIMHL
ncbi:Protein SWEETIE, partial [Mucuna pruriens]